MRERNGPSSAMTAPGTNGPGRPNFKAGNLVSVFAKNLLLAAVYFFTGKFGLRLAFLNASASAIWPPTGIALAALLLLGYEVLPGIWLGAFLVNLTTAGTVLTSIGIAAGNTLEAFWGAWLIERCAHGRGAFERATDIFRFILLAAILSTTVSATMGVTSLALGGFVPPSHFVPVWFTWWLGDMVSALIVTPLIVIWSSLPSPRWTRPQMLEYALILTVVATTGLLGYSGLFVTTLTRFFPRFLFYPVLMWAAYRFGPRGAISAAFTLSCIAIWGTLHGFGPFASGDPNGSLLLLQTFIGTITVTNLVLGGVVLDRQRGEESLHESQQRMHIAQQTARWGVFDYSYITGKNQWTPELEALYGLPPGGFEGTYESWLKRVHPDDRQRVDQEVKQAVEAGECSHDFRVVWPDGSVHWLLSQMRIFRDDDGSPLRALGVNVDITERKHAVDALRENQLRLAGLINSAMDAIIAIDEEQRIVLFNPAAEKMFGCGVSQAMGGSIEQFLPASLREAHRAHIKNFGETGVTDRRMGALGAISGRRAGGEEFPIEASISQTKVNGRKLFTVILRDITERKLAEQSIQRINESLERRVAERTAELARASELLQAEVLERKQLEREIARAVEREQLRMGHKLHEGLGQELTGINYLMAALHTKLAKGSRTRAREAKKLQTMLLQSIEQTRSLAREFYPIELEQHGLLVALEGIVKTPRQASEALYVVESDGNPAYAGLKGSSAIQLFRIAQEAVHNALTHAKARTIVVRLATVSGQLVLTVKDDGAGLPVEVEESTGMGFRIMRYRAGMVGGKLDVCSKPNAGVLVTCSVPDEQWFASAPTEQEARTDDEPPPTPLTPPLV